jgi:hypothetical protein
VFVAAAEEGLPGGGEAAGDPRARRRAGSSPPWLTGSSARPRSATRMVRRSRRTGSCSRAWSVVRTTSAGYATVSGSNESPSSRAAEDHRHGPHYAEVDASTGCRQKRHGEPDPQQEQGEPGTPSRCLVVRSPHLRHRPEHRDPLHPVARCQVSLISLCNSSWFVPCLEYNTFHPCACARRRRSEAGKARSVRVRTPRCSRESNNERTASRHRPGGDRRIRQASCRRAGRHDRRVRQQPRDVRASGTLRMRKDERT